MISDSNYIINVRRELERWEKQVLKEPWLLEKLSKGFQQRVDRLIPEKIHQSMAKAMQISVKSVISSIEMLPFSEQKLRNADEKLLIEKDFECDQLVSRYKKIAAAEGIGTGVGGILLAAADYPALLTIKLKFLSEAAQIYGFDIRNFSERLFFLKVFQLAFSSDESRSRIYYQVKHWNENIINMNDVTSEGSLDWLDFYKEYKESIEFKKMLSFVPIIGAVFNGWGNYSLLEELGKTAKNSYRIRLLK